MRLLQQPSVNFETASFVFLFAEVGSLFSMAEGNASSLPWPESRGKQFLSKELPESDGSSHSLRNQSSFDEMLAGKVTDDDAVQAL
jgi:hypothetical protein